MTTSKVARKKCCSQSHRKEDHCHLVLQTFLRLRPFLKKERDDTIVLEPLAGNVGDDSTGNGPLAAVAMHPLPREDAEILSPSSSLVMATLTPPETIKEAHTVEFYFDHVLAAEANQEKVHFSLGFPMASSVMESLKVDPSPKVSTRKRSHLVIGMGVMGAGKSYTCLGGMPVTKRKSPADGLVPRVVDSLFSQSKHHVNKRNLYFAVNISVIQVNQSKSVKASPSEDCVLHDLLQPVAKFSFSTSPLSSVSKSAKAQTMASGFEKTKEYSTINKLNNISSSYSSLDEPVSVKQDPVSSDFRVINGQIRTCRTVEDARDALHISMINSRKLTTKQCYSHILVQLQPVLVDRTGKTMRSGGTIAVLDMSGKGRSSSPKAHRSILKRSKDIANHNDAHSAVLHCLRILQYNEQVMAGNVPIIASPSDDESDISCVSQEKEDRQRQDSLKKVPYLQHKLTMLLQPFFSAQYTGKTFVTLLLSAYPGHRDYADNKSLIQEVQSLKSSHQSTERNQTDVKDPSSWRRRERARCEQKNNDENSVVKSDAKDEGHIASETLAEVPADIFKNHFFAPRIENIHSATYSKPLDEGFSEEEEELRVERPPPVAPQLSNPATSLSLGRTAVSLEPSAPQELLANSPDFSRSKSSNPETVLIDFPGASIPSSSETNSRASNLPFSNQKCAPKIERKAFTTNTRSTRLPLNAALKGLGTSISSTPKPHSSSHTSFDPTKRLGKVHSSTEKRKDTVKKTTTIRPPNEYTATQSLAKNSIDDYNSMEQRVNFLETRNAKLLNENQGLRDKNRKLKKENDNLRSKLRQGKIVDENRQAPLSSHGNNLLGERHQKYPLGTPLMDHIARVRNESQNDGQWNIPANNSPFTLQCPRRPGHYN